MYNFSFFGQILFCKHFYYITGFCDKKFNFCKFANFFADSKSRAQELSYDVSFVIFGHQTWDLERGGQIDRLPAYPSFQVYPSRDRVNILEIQNNSVLLNNSSVPSVRGIMIENM